MGAIDRTDRSEVALLRCTVVIGVVMLHLLHLYLLDAILRIGTGGGRGDSVTSFAVLEHPPSGCTEGDKEEDAIYNVSGSSIKRLNLIGVLCPTLQLRDCALGTRAPPFVAA